MTIKYVQDISRVFCNINQAQNNLQIHPICLNDSDHDYIIDEILLVEKIEYEININFEYDVE